MSTRSLALQHSDGETRLCFSAVDAAPTLDFLSEGEKERLDGFQFTGKRQSFLLGRLAAKRALGGLLEEADLRKIEIRAGIYGQPLVAHPRAGSVEVTVSHSQGLAVALAYPPGFPMGIDLETVAAVSPATIVGELGASPAEFTWLATGGVDEATACCVLWTAREALGKALRIGLNSPLGTLALSDIRSDGAGSWIGRYLNFPRCQCLSQAKDGRVLTLALPSESALSGPLQ